VSSTLHVRIAAGVRAGHRSARRCSNAGEERLVGQPVHARRTR
jgi:hypothetical protein